MWFLKSLFKYFTGKKTSPASSSSRSTNSVAKDDVFVKARSGAFTQETILRNDTDKTLYLRDKVGAAYGGTRYKILGKSQIKVAPLQHTFFKMLAYAVEDEDRESHSVTRTPTRMSTDTRLTIDSDQLADSKEIIIYLKDGEYKVDFRSR